MTRNPHYWNDRAEMPPYVWAYIYLGMELYDWQIETLDAIGQRLPTALVAANESGKTSHIAVAACLWFLHTYGKAGGKIVMTSGSWLQLETQLMPAVRRLSSVLPDWDFQMTQAKRKGNQDPQLILFSTDSPGRAEGHHAIDAEKAPLFIVADEAKSIPDSIFTAFDRCGPQFLLLMSSPGDSSGRFYDCFNKNRSLYWTRRVRSVDCPHIPEAKRQRDLALYGATHPLYLSMHEAEFVEDADRLIITKDLVRSVLETQPEYQAGIQTAFCDFAAGGDENALAVREGNRIWIQDAWREKDTMQASRQFVEHFKSLNIRPAQIHGDASGLGIVMIDSLAEQGWRINKTYNNAAAEDKSNYANADAEAWFEFERMLRMKEIIIPNDKILFEQLTSRRWEYGERGKIRLESKEKMASRGLSSPDRADAVIGAAVHGRVTQQKIVVSPRPTPRRMRPSRHSGKSIYA